MTQTPVRFTSLKRMARSAAHYLYELENPSEATPAMRLGSVVDALTFGTCPILETPTASRRGKEYAAWIKDQDPNGLIVTPAELEIGKGMALSLMKHRPAMLLLSKGIRQKRLTWTMAGRECAGTPDAIDDDDVTDLKSTRNGNPGWFIHEARRLAYHAQLDWYMHAHEIVTKRRPVRAHIVTVENTPPYVVTVFSVTDQALLEGRKLWTIWFERLRACEAAGHFPGYVECEAPFDVPDSDELKLIIDGEEVEV